MKKIIVAAVAALALVACAPAERPSQKQWKGAFVTIENADGSEVPEIDVQWLEAKLTKADVTGSVNVVVASFNGSCGDFHGSFRVTGTVSINGGEPRKITGRGMVTKPWGLLPARSVVCAKGRADALRNAILD
jgi:hypothetical protein